ncbi:MAG: hypothetical protein A3A98_03710 [Candidatus Staskawiczbacteria bacterium RIFCSPLOWO2_01_FULL_40_39]|uniref:DUF4382 domain-containing protein n=1 Tax=Candidatus Staskawiczbacteria bacterium RIFCSPHIGHO2_01_FULL_39_25 TaxID=1802202 RepID=A0A1G2HNL8_9BACT|nr:MAG: hypothetical protein A2730_02925 [Candidatus Staskawiczbacteria bacterium RIFCSPHIGHO2_01_FULL_39_25]OGZ73518.1 MAG: hypothetical protein A3A98_03710 [Candidatus Staskawiczbacteria bacterium RIFCSPLOWO2_01_FULL_40_39]OGZ76634.1 MAG: hypothetical protein A3I87_02850 [Candidatus Staskawiczbacteria bacterium RIFCSPLOWO2_02_FULL_39_8]
MENNKNIILTVVIVALIALAALGVYYYNQEIPENGDSTTNGTEQGKMILGITDAAASMENISSVWLTVNKVEIHDETKGWIVVSNETKQYDLLALKQSGAIALLATADIDAGTYNQVRIMVSKVVVVENGVEKEAKLPSKELKIVGRFVVNEDKTSTAVFDFLADKSLHVTGNGKIIFAPVIKLDSKSNADVQVKTNSEVTINGGRKEDEKTVGMDEKGELKVNFILDTKDGVDILGDVIKIMVKGESESNAKISANTAIDTAVDKGYLDVALSVKMTTQNNTKAWMVSGLKDLELKNILINASTGTVITAE